VGHILAYNIDFFFFLRNAYSIDCFTSCKCTVNFFYCCLTNCGNLTAELLGFDDYIPPYASASDDAILKGVNYASAAAGIREETGRQLVCIYSI
jgi:hypothetical protein